MAMKKIWAKQELVRRKIVQMEYAKRQIEYLSDSELKELLGDS